METRREIAIDVVREMVMGKVEEEMETAAAELEPRSRYLSGLIQQRRRKSDVNGEAAEEERPKGGSGEAAKAPRKQVVVVVRGRKEAALAIVEVVPEPPRGLGLGGSAVLREQARLVRVRVADMAPALQKRAFWCAGEVLAGMGRLDSKRLALAMKKEFDSSYGPAWHCVVGINFGSYVTHSVGGFLYFSINRVYILLFKTTVKALENN